MRKSQWTSGGRRRQKAFTNAALYRPAQATGDSVIHEAAMGLHFHARINDFIETSARISYDGRALKIAAISRRKDPAKLSCCRNDFLQ